MTSVSSGHIVMQTLICTRKSVHIYEKSSFSLLSVAFTFRWWGQYGTRSEGSGAPETRCEISLLWKGTSPRSSYGSTPSGLQGSGFIQQWPIEFGIRTSVKLGLSTPFSSHARRDPRSDIDSGAGRTQATSNYEDRRQAQKASKNTYVEVLNDVHRTHCMH
jgi:hypothetical protein